MKSSYSAVLATALLMASLAALLACSGGSTAPAAAPNSSAPTPAPVALSLAAQVGRKIFFDKSLSGSGKMSCATCHDPDSGYGPPNSLAVQLGGADLTAHGTRAAPSLRYLQYTPPYADLLDNPDGVSVPGPGGGLTWDGRAATLAEQARIPLLAANEMGNASAQAVLAKLRLGAYTDLFEQAYGKGALASEAGFAYALQALQAFQLEEPSFHPYTSKFDLYAGNKVGGALSPSEARGLKLFSDAKGANCASCHYQGAGLNGSSGLFTDFSYAAIGVPRNPSIAENLGPAYFDLGLCGPNRKDHVPAAPSAPNKFCGLFKAPSLRNVATRNSFFHNGAMHSLEQTIRFYNTRDTMPELWYPTVGGVAKAVPDAKFPNYGLITTQYTGGIVQKFDDLPPAYRGNIDTQLPLDGRKPGDPNPMSDAQIGDLICFLKTLSDGYQPAAPPSGACGN
ncbi:cytochrome c peroxidase [Oxalobacteraceae bacterium GrIS 1.11]